MAKANIKYKKALVDKIKDGLMSSIRSMPISDCQPQKAKVTLYYPNSYVTISVNIAEEEGDDV